MENYKISIVIPVFNDETYLEEVLNSLLRQTIGFPNLQIIFIDDCSTDKSQLIIKQYSMEYSNVFVLYTDHNSGAGGKPRNLGLEIATAEFLMFLDADDYYPDDACETLYTKIKETGVDVVSGYHAIVDSSGKIIVNKTAPFQNQKGKTIYLDSGLEDAFALKEHWCCKIYKKSIICDNKIAFPEGTPGQDTVFFINYLLLSKTFHYIDHKVYYYRQRTKNDLSITKNHTSKYFLKANTYYGQMYSLVKKFEHEELFQLLIREVFPSTVLFIIDSKIISNEETLEILKAYNWLFLYCIQKDLFSDNYYLVSLEEAITIGDYEHALHIILAIRLFRFEALSYLEGKRWLEGQLKNHIEALENLKEYSDQRESIISSQQQQITWLEGQLKNHTEALDNLKNFLLNSKT